MMIIKCCTDGVWLDSFSHSFCLCQRNEVLKHQMWINPLQEIVPYECTLPWHHWAALLWCGSYVSIYWCDHKHRHTHTHSKYGECWRLLRDSKFIMRFSPAQKHSGVLQNIWWSFNSLYWPKDPLHLKGTTSIKNKYLWCFYLLMKSIYIDKKSESTFTGRSFMSSNCNTWNWKPVKPSQNRACNMWERTSEKS